MTLARLLLTNLRYHWRGNLAVLLGVVVGTAVLTGALLVGDSLRGSLRDLTLRRLGWVDQALVAPRLFRGVLARKIAEDAPPGFRVVSALLLQGSVIRRQSDGKLPPRPVRRVTIIGIDPAFADTDGAAWINSTLAEELNAKAGEDIVLRLQKPSETPRESLLGHKDADAVVSDVPLAVGRVLMADDPLDPFSLRPDLEAPRTVFVPLKLLQDKLGLKGQVNAILAGGPFDAASAVGITPGLSGKVSEWLAHRVEMWLDLADWGLVLSTPTGRARAVLAQADTNGDGTLQASEWRRYLPRQIVDATAGQGNVVSLAALEDYYRTNHPYLALESRRVILEPAVAQAAMSVAAANKLRSAPTLVYLANTIEAGDASVPYSIVAALDPTLPSPLGPFLPPGVTKLADDEIVLAAWKESPLKVKPGDPVTLRYFDSEHQGEPRETSATFRFAGFVPLSGPADDSNLPPDFPGITDAEDLYKVKAPFPYDPQRIALRDDRYWKQYRTTPKAYVTLAAGQKLWASRFGDLTSIRLAPEGGGDLDTAAKEFRAGLLRSLKPEDGGFVFQPVKEQALQAGAAGMDFAGLFLAFSFFLIVAALLLVSLLFRLNLDRRASEVGVLLASGYRVATVRRLLLAEGLILAAVGAALGLLVAVGYASLLVQFLQAYWPGGTLRSFLRPHVTVASLAVGYLASVFVSVLTVGLSLRTLRRISPVALLRGQTTSEGSPTMPSRPIWRISIALVASIGAIAAVLASGFATGTQIRAMTFFAGGGLLLVAGLAALSVWLHSGRRATVEAGSLAVGRLGMRNAARNPTRSLLTAGLLASAAFLVVAVDAFRREAEEGDATHSPSGGFALLGESDLPLFRDLNTEEARAEILDSLRLVYLGQGLAPKDAEEKLRPAEILLEKINVVPLRVRAGDDASCLNLYQPRRPKVYGVPESLIRRGGFQFSATAETLANPWLSLRDPGPPYPAFGEQNTLQWVLHVGLGDELKVPDAAGEQMPLRIAGMLHDSIFQNGLLVSEQNFLALYPGAEGYTFFLIEAPADNLDEVAQILETGLASRGFEVSRTARRLESYLAVENTYLSTFQALGGLGLLLGALGLAVVLVRGVWERRGELALLRALGYRRTTLAAMVLAENAFLLVAGLGIGAVAALVSVAPQLTHQGGGVQWPRMLALLGGVLLTGLLAGAFAVATTLRAPLIPALRRE